MKEVHTVWGSILKNNLLLLLKYFTTLISRNFLLILPKRNKFVITLQELHIPTDIVSEHDLIVGWMLVDVI
jgi:hypothetical protein